MQFSSALYALAMAGLVAAAPTPAPDTSLEARDDPFWYMVGWGNPNCQGSLVWVYTGSGNVCQNVPAMAASVSGGTNRSSVIGFRNTPNCGLAKRTAESEAAEVFAPVTVRVPGVEKSLAARQVDETCWSSFTAGVWAFEITRI